MGATSQARERLGEDRDVEECAAQGAGARDDEDVHPWHFSFINHPGPFSANNKNRRNHNNQE